ncbi:MAG TPA: DoxX family protein [Solirubrobacteraceae bacterium]|jgi:putative oxidoreductase|nr:DoxX family protein [Solirubrobacteraceae bacterium]
MKVGRLLLRAAVGGFFIGHGTQKLFGWFGGQGLKTQAEHFEGMGLKPGIVHASAAGAAETLGGAGLLLGYRTPLASASIISVMLTAINRVHLKNGPWAHKGGYEYNAVLIAAAASLAESGPGGLSLDNLRGKEKSGWLWGVFSLVAGAAGAAGAHLLAESRATPVVAAPETGAPSSSANGTDPVAVATPAEASHDAAAEEEAQPEETSSEASEA